MRLFYILLAVLTVVSACEKYTDATSPCFGKDGDPVVSRSAATPLTFVGTETGTGTDEKNCDFEPIGNGS
ncbi:hypothetical protein [uncultured Roseovarius sp.]|uniref:hypothetical protein n=1 Tax=uncultured Roseovarius sp. TaxID=293344 RepID=UPI0026145432|nr:hypothetical protein [uncultured Roseovarius sp.]